MAARRRPGSRLLLACALLAAGSALAAAAEEGGLVFKKLERTVRGERREERGKLSARRGAPLARATLRNDGPRLISLSP
jgi:hypothetical protein